MQNVTVDFEKCVVREERPEGTVEYPFESNEAFMALSEAWIRVGWDTKYVYGFTWMGRPIIQLPDDLVRLQEAIYSVKPDVIIECGVAHGGGLIFYASLLKAMGKGKVVGVELELRPHNRKAIDEHEMKPLISIVDGSSIEESTVEKVKEHIKPGDTVMVLLDSNHKRDHVYRELELYGPLVTKGSYIVAMDGVMRKVAGGPRTAPDWAINNPETAALDFVKAHPEFQIVEPAFPFNEGIVKDRVTYWPNAFVQRVK